MRQDLDSSGNCVSRTISSRSTRTVMVGAVAVGGDNPIRIQSMINCATKDVEGSVAQLRDLQEAGCEIARLTVPTRADLEALPQIRQRMREESVSLPLVADIHYSPELAIASARWVEKVRINPGNYGEKHSWKHSPSDTEYQQELLEVRSRLEPLITALKQHHRSLRIGTNHGSLSSRVLNRWGNTPEGMVVSALEYIEICEQLDYYDIIISMKASSPRVMTDACYLLEKRLAETGRDYPLHLGVTEAGQGRDGVIRSAIGIGALLLDGIGDTIRVSLTDTPAEEIAPALEIIEVLQQRETTCVQDAFRTAEPFTRNAQGRRQTSVIQTGEYALGGDLPPVVTVPAISESARRPEFSVAQDDLPGLTFWPDRSESRVVIPATDLERLTRDDLPPLLEVLFSAGLPESELKLFRSLELNPTRTMVAIRTNDLLTDNRLLAGACPRYPLDIYCDTTTGTGGISLAMQCGALLLDGIGDSLTLLLEGAEYDPAELAFTILQGSGRRLTRVELISCPTCGRTRFDMAAAVRRVRELTGHLSGLKIAVMGCVVNGPGEMADADFGYVGAGPDLVHLYRAGELVEKNLPAEAAADRLVALIKAAGRWQE